MTLDLKTAIEPADTLNIEAYIRRALTHAALPEYRSTIAGISTPTFNQPKPLCKVIANSSVRFVPKRLVDLKLRIQFHSLQSKPLSQRS